MRNKLVNLVLLAEIALFSISPFGCRTSGTSESAGINWEKRRMRTIKESYLSSAGVYDFKGDLKITSLFTEIIYRDLNGDRIFDSEEKKVYSVNEKNEKKLKSIESKDVKIPIEEFYERGYFKGLKIYGPY